MHPRPQAGCDSGKSSTGCTSWWECMLTRWSIGDGLTGGSVLEKWKSPGGTFANTDGFSMFLESTDCVTAALVSLLESSDAVQSSWFFSLEIRLNSTTRRFSSNRTFLLLLGTGSDEDVRGFMVERFVQSSLGCSLAEFEEDICFKHRQTILWFEPIPKEKITQREFLAVIPSSLEVACEYGWRKYGINFPDNAVAFVSRTEHYLSGCLI